MKQELMLGGDLCWCGHGRHRFVALALDRHQQPQAVIMHRLLSIGMAQHDAERLDIARKSRFTPLTQPVVHSGPPIRMNLMVWRGVPPGWRKPRRRLDYMMMWRNSCR